MYRSNNNNMQFYPAVPSHAKHMTFDQPITHRANPFNFNVNSSNTTDSLSQLLYYNHGVHFPDNANEKTSAATTVTKTLPKLVAQVPCCNSAVQPQKKPMLTTDHEVANGARKEEEGRKPGITTVASMKSSNTMRLIPAKRTST